MSTVGPLEAHASITAFGSTVLVRVTNRGEVPLRLPASSRPDPAGFPAELFVFDRPVAYVGPSGDGDDIVVLLGIGESWTSPAVDLATLYDLRHGQHLAVRYQGTVNSASGPAVIRSGSVPVSA